MPDAQKLLLGLADHHSVTTVTNASCVATISGKTGLSLVVQSVEISMSTAPASPVSATLSDGTNVIAQYEIPASTLAPITISYPNGLQCASGNAASITVPALGTGVACTAGVHAFYHSGGSSTLITPGVSPVVDFTFDGYASDAAFRAATADFASGEFDSQLTQQSLEVASGLPATISGISKTLKMTWPGNQNLTDYVIARAVALPSASRKIWYEIWMKHSSNFSTINAWNITNIAPGSPPTITAPGAKFNDGQTAIFQNCTGNAASLNGNGYFIGRIDDDHFTVTGATVSGGAGGSVYNLSAWKFIGLILDVDGYGWQGVWETNSGDFFMHWFAETGETDHFGVCSTDVWTGNWFCLRGFSDLGTANGNNSYLKTRIYGSDGALIVGQDSGPINNAYGSGTPKHRAIEFFKNIDPGTPPADMTTNIARIRAWTTDPGWGF